MKPQFLTNQHTHPKKSYHGSWTSLVKVRGGTSSSPVHRPFICITNQSNSNQPHQHTSTTFNHNMDFLLFSLPFLFGGGCEGKKSAQKKSLVDLVCFSSPYAPPYPKAFFPWPTKKKRRNNGGLGPESPEAIHSDPDDGELVSVVKEALANLDHALLERHFFWGREGWIYCFGPDWWWLKKKVVLIKDGHLLGRLNIYSG